MRVVPGVLATSALTVALVGVSAPAALAVCDPYAEKCVDTVVKDKVQDKPVAVQRQEAPRARANSPETLPFTGGEVTLMLALGGGALAAGAAMVVAGRRRTAEV